MGWVGVVMWICILTGWLHKGNPTFVLKITRNNYLLNLIDGMKFPTTETRKTGVWPVCSGVLHIDSDVHLG